MKTGYAVRRPVENSYLVRERDRRRLRDLGKVLLLVAPLGALLLGYTWIHLSALDTAYRIREQERELDRLARRQRELQVEAAYLASPRRIEQLAASELGMGPPRLEQVVFWEVGPP